MFEDELDDLDIWIEAMENKNDTHYALHVILAYDKADRQQYMS